jgi:hypothetical protein
MSDPKTEEVDGCLSYKPSGYYFRKALREAKTKEDAVEIGLQAVREMEHLKKVMRENHGIIPPRRFILSSEAKAKKLA